MTISTSSSSATFNTTTVGPTQGSTSNQTTSATTREEYKLVVVRAQPGKLIIFFDNNNFLTLHPQFLDPADFSNSSQYTMALVIMVVAITGIGIIYFMCPNDLSFENIVDALDDANNDGDRDGDNGALSKSDKHKVDSEKHRPAAAPAAKQSKKQNLSKEPKMNSSKTFNTAKPYTLAAKV